MFCLAAPSAYVEKIYGDDYFDGGEGGYTNYLENKTALISQGKKYSRIIRRQISAGDLLDIGSAAGFLLHGFESDGWTGTGVEPNTGMAQYAQNELGLNVINQAFEDFQTDRTFDAATLIQVISHVPNPVDCLTRIHGLLKEQGVLLVETWNRKSLTAKLFGKNWHQYNPPSVLHWYSRSELTQMLNQAGFNVISTGRPTKWISVGNGAALVQHSFRESTIGRVAVSPLGLIPKALKVPYFLDDVFWVLAQKG